MRLQYKNIYQFFLTVSLLLGGVYFFQGCSSYEDEMLGSFPFLEISINDTSISNSTHRIQIPINTNREWTTSVNYLNSDDTRWISITSDNKNKTITLAIQDNRTENSRDAVILVKNSSNGETKQFTVEQAPVSSRTYDGLLVFKNQKELDENTYTHVNGAVIIGNAYRSDSISESKASGTTIKIGGYEYTVDSSNISNLSKLSMIRNISEGVLYVLNTELDKVPVDLFSNLKLNKLYLDWNDISDLYDIKSLSTITEFSISHNKISNIASLSELYGIQKLNIAGNQIKDISVLSGMRQITHLTLGESANETNRIMDINVLNELSSLEYLSLSGLPIDKEQIRQLNLPPNCVVVAENLKGFPLPIVTTNEPVFSNNQLSLSGSFELRDQNIKIESYGFYYGTTKDLKEMTFKQAEISGSDFSTTLDELDDNKRYFIRAAVKTTDGTSFGEFKTFGESIFEGNIFVENIDDITKFQKDGYSSIQGAIIIGNSSTTNSENAISISIDSVTYYFSKNSDISDISFLADLKRIGGGVYVVNTEVSNLTPITQIDATPTICLAKNKIESIPDLSSILGLTTLNISMNQIENIENISLLRGLTSLYLGDKNYLELETNKIKDVTSLYALSSLRVLDISGLPITNQSISDLRVALSGCTIYAEGMTAPKAPKVTTLEASDITTMEAVLKGTVVSQGDANITEYGFYFGADTLNLEKIVISGSTVSSGSSFEHNVNNLQVNFAYFFKAFAINENGESIGEMMTFKAGRSSNGTIILRTQEEVDNFPNLGYNKIVGNLIIGRATKGAFDGYETNRWIDNNNYYFANTNITNLDSLASLIDVTEGVYIVWNKNLSEISFLSRFKNTTILDVEHNDISDLLSIAQLTNLTSLNCSNNKISSLQPIAQLTKLTELYCDNNEISGLSGVDDLTNLTSLSCSNNKISSLQPLAQLTKLTYINCQSNEISSLSGVEQLTNLTRLYCSGNNISSLQPVEQLTNLTELYCSGNNISSLQPVAQLINLTSLDLQNNKISEISVLENFTSLTWLSLSYNSIKNIDILKNLSKLEYIYLNGLPLTQVQVDELRTSLPDCTIDALNLQK